MKWIYSYSKENLDNNIKFFIAIYEKVRKDPNYKDKFSIKWGYELKNTVEKKHTQKIS